MREGDEPVIGMTREERRRDPSRVLALTDGVFAIIITLLGTGPRPPLGVRGTQPPSIGACVPQAPFTGKLQLARVCPWPHLAGTAAHPLMRHPSP